MDRLIRLGDVYRRAEADLRAARLDDAEFNAIINAIEGAPVVEHDSISGLVRKPKDEWYGHSYICQKCSAEMMVSDAEGNAVIPASCPVCAATFDPEQLSYAL